ncbi:hypothetical protein OU995_21600 [Roseateles sp. SL47]|uniref:hypothetical protein n=1 Tax=Roseateles sp. SL47 TaxID=2995138 RepID=UPI002271F568|nr:hypothetical protein [Roseateles sp. SL47]WAC72132.1 hypothetical protein OU995_21600 [Roseateles sp. SL47]
MLQQMRTMLSALLPDQTPEDTRAASSSAAPPGGSRPLSTASALTPASRSIGVQTDPSVTGCSHAVRAQGESTVSLQVAIQMQQHAREHERWINYRKALMEALRKNEALKDSQMVTTLAILGRQWPPEQAYIQFKRPSGWVVISSGKVTKMQDPSSPPPPSPPGVDPVEILYCEDGSLEAGTASLPPSARWQIPRSECTVFDALIVGIQSANHPINAALLNHIFDSFRQGPAIQREVDFCGYPTGNYRVAMDMLRLRCIFDLDALISSEVSKYQTHAPPSGSNST